MELSTADPVPTSVRFYLAALLSNSVGREICRCFFFFFSLHKQMHQAKLSQAADGRQCVRCTKRKMFCSGLRALGRDVVSAKYLNIVTVLLDKQSICFVFQSVVKLSQLNLPGMKKKNFSDFG